MDYIKLFPAVSPSEAAGLWVLSLICPSQLPAIAEALLEEGFDAPALRRLAAEEPGSEAVGRWFEETIQSLTGRGFSNAREAATELIDSLATKIASGAVPAYLGAKAIWEISLADGVDTPKEAHPFIYAASEYEDRPEDREFFCHSIVDEAKLLVAKRGQGTAPARPIKECPDS